MSSEIVNQKSSVQIKSAKIYYLDATPFWQHLRPRILLFSIGRTTFVESFIWYQKSLQKDNEIDDTPSINSKFVTIVKHIAYRVGLGVMWHVGTITLLRSFELTTQLLLSDSMANKFVKNTPASAIRKANRSGNGKACLLIIKTSLLSELLTHTSLFIAEQLFRRPAEIGHLDFAKKNGLKHSASLIASGVGASIGTLIVPGSGTWVGSTLGEVLINSNLQ